MRHNQFVSSSPTDLLDNLCRLLHLPPIPTYGTRFSRLFSRPQQLLLLRLTPPEGVPHVNQLLVGPRGEAQEFEDRQKTMVQA